VGPTSDPFSIHESILRSSPSVLANALKPVWRDNNAVQLPECDRDAFSTYAQWLYNGRVGIISSPDESLELIPGNDDRVTNEWARWAACYILADFLRDPDFADALIDVALEIVSTCGRVSPILGPTIYKYSTRGSLHRKFAVWAIASGANIAVTGKLGRGEYGCNELVVDLLAAFAKAQRAGRRLRELYEGEERKCEYHEHGGGDCYRVKRGWMYALDERG
jgi:hypothetical protein